MIKHTLERLYREEDGTEMVEWAIVAVFFAVAGSLIWGDVAAAVENGLQNVINLF